MGLFALPMGETPEDVIRSLRSNCDMYLQDPSRDYLFGFMKACLNQAIALDEMKKNKELKDG